MTSRARPARKTAEPPERPPTFSGFVVRLLLYLFLASLLFSIGDIHERMGPIQEAMAKIVAAGANLLGAEASVDGSVVRAHHAGKLDQVAGPL